MAHSQGGAEPHVPTPLLLLDYCSVYVTHTALCKCHCEEGVVCHSLCSALRQVYQSVLVKVAQPEALVHLLALIEHVSSFSSGKYVCVFNLLIYITWLTCLAVLYSFHIVT